MSTFDAFMWMLIVTCFGILLRDLYNWNRKPRDWRATWISVVGIASYCAVAFIAIDGIDNWRELGKAAVLFAALAINGEAQVARAAHNRAKAVAR